MERLLSRINLTWRTFSWCVVMFTGSNAIGQFNPGLENNSALAGWSSNSSPNGGIGTNNVSRSGGKAIFAEWNSSTATTADVQHDGYSVTVPGAGYYVHVIGWCANTHTNISVGVGVKNVNTSTSWNSPMTIPGAYARYTHVSAISTAAHTYVPKFRASNGNSTSTRRGVGDDFIIYYSGSITTDIVAPGAPTNLCVNSSGGNNVLTWTDGADAAGNLNGVMILRAPVGTALPTVRDQAQYSTNIQIGPNYLHNGWTVLSNTLTPGTQTFTDAGAAGTPYIYAVYMRDIAYNYSAPISFTTANAGSDQSLCGAPASVTMAATAAPGGYSGTWSLVSGGGSITTPNSATTTITAIPAGINTYRWTVTNGSGCTTSDEIIVSVNTSAPSLPILGAPANGSSIAASPVNLVWGNGGGADTYVVSLGTSSPPGTSYPSQTSNSYFAGSLSPNTTYYWRVTATNACGTTVGTIWNFNTLPVYSNTGSAGCNAWDSGDTYTGFTRTIDLTAAGLPIPLGTGSGQYVLNEVEVHLGSSGCKRDLSTYDFRLTAPNGAFIDFFPTNKLTTNTSVQWVRVKFRDHAALEMINEYPNLHQEDIHPYSIGYYAIETVDGFLNTFNGVNPNGVWTFAIKENSSDEISFNSVTLKFGPKILVNDIQNQVYYDNCVTSQCFDGRQVTVASNMYLQNGDPILTATNPNGSCWYNGANNNSGWFDFKASSTTAYITVSGMSSSSTNNQQMQLVVVRKPAAGCVDQGGAWVIPPGGCSLASSTPANNTAYLSGNGGGNFTYTSGITGNVEFNLSGLTVGQTYYLYIDGNGGATSPFYIEGLTGIATCDNLVVPLPIEWYSFNANIYNKTTHITWQTASERNNDYFIVERSHDGIAWEFLEKVKGAGSSTELLSYMTYDFHPYRGVGYYRIKQVDYDGKSTYSEIRSVYNTEDLMILPNPSTGIFGVGGMPKHQENTIMVLDITGKVLEQHSTEEESYQLDLTQRSAGIYLVIINGTESIKVIKE